MAKIYQPTEENLRQLREFLRFGELVAVPTETVYGLAANALDADACRRVFTAKRRPPSDPLICHIASFDFAERYAETNELARRLAKEFWPGPLTLVLTKRRTIPDIVTSGLDSVGLRSPDHTIFQALVAEGIDFPLAAPSANPFAYISPTTAAHVQASLGYGIRHILDGGPCAMGLESTILDVRDVSHPRLLRYGALSVDRLQGFLGEPIAQPAANRSGENQPIAPGSLPKHYSPRTRLRLVSAISSGEIDSTPPNTGFLLLRKPAEETRPNVYTLSQDGCLKEIAANLFAALREADNQGYREIVAEEAPELGLGMAINDRLRRAAYR